MLLPLCQLIVTQCSSLLFQTSAGCCSFKCCHRRSFKCCCRHHNNKCCRRHCCTMQLCCVTAVLMYSISIPNSWECDSMGVSLRILLHVGMPCKIPCQQRINPTPKICCIVSYPVCLTPIIIIFKERISDIE